MSFEGCECFAGGTDLLTALHLLSQDCQAVGVLGPHDQIQFDPRSQAPPPAGHAAGAHEGEIGIDGGLRWAWRPR